MRGGFKFRVIIELAGMLKSHTVEAVGTAHDPIKPKRKGPPDTWDEGCDYEIEWANLYMVHNGKTRRFCDAMERAWNETGYIDEPIREALRA